MKLLVDPFAHRRGSWSGFFQSGSCVLRPSVLVKIDLKEASFRRRGFPEARGEGTERLEGIGRAFLEAANRALATRSTADLVCYANSVALDDRGFAIEGATFGIALADGLNWGQDQLPEWLDAVRDQHSYLAHVGLGWTLARLPWRKSRFDELLDPVHRWLVEDGTGFHDCYFRSSRILAGWRRRRSGYATHAYDQGIGRALWFVSGARIDEALRLVSQLDRGRRGDLVSGLGLALAYAGGVAGEELLRALADLADSDCKSLAQGAAFAAEAMVRAGHLHARSDERVKALTGRSAHEASTLVRGCRSDVLTSPGEADAPVIYEAWRRRVGDALHSNRRKVA